MTDKKPDIYEVAKSIADANFPDGTHLFDTIADLCEQNAELKAHNEELRAEVNQLKAANERLWNSRKEILRASEGNK